MNEKFIITEDIKKELKSTGIYTVPLDTNMQDYIDKLYDKKSKKH